MFFFLCLGPSLLFAIASSKSIPFNVENYKIGNVAANASNAAMNNSYWVNKNWGSVK
jgi:hypothetical protein